MKKLLLIVVIIVTQILLSAEADDLFISEYLEGSGQNKALEIFNGTGDVIDLSEYSIRQSHNGDGWGNASGEAYVLELQGNIADGDVLVIAVDQADQEILLEADIVLAYPSVVHFNGNDAVGLFKNGNLIDVIGVANEDVSWSVAGVSSATQEHTLVRKPEVEAGTVSWSESAGTNEGNSQWLVYPQDSFMFLGAHSMGEDEEAPQVSEIYPAWENQLEIIFNEPVEQSSAENIANYQIDGIEVYDAVLAEESCNLIILETSVLDEGDYILTINGVSDLNGNIMNNVSTGFFYKNWEIVINEIHYNPATSQGSDDDYEFIELFNKSTYLIDLSGYQFVSGVEFTFPEESSLDSGEYALIARNMDSYQFVTDILWQWDSGGQLTNGGETIILQNSEGDIVDRVAYLPGSGWASAANGNGATLELTSAESHNALYENWQASVIDGGTPGEENSTTSVEDSEILSAKIKMQNYPNPFSMAGGGRGNGTIISFYLSDLCLAGQVEIEIYNAKGQCIREYKIENPKSTINEVTWYGKDNRGKSVASGIYFYSLKLGDKTVISRKMMIIR